MAGVHGNLSHAMRDNYNEHGVDEYYRKVAASYRNPFFPGIKKVVWTFMNRWWEAEGKAVYASNTHGSSSGSTKDNTAGERLERLRVLDMAAGSGEATLCLLEWAESGKPGASSLSSSSNHASTSRSPSSSLPSTPQPYRAEHVTGPPDPLAALQSITSPSPILGGRPAFIPPNARRPAAGSHSAGPLTSGRKGRLVFGGTEPASLPSHFELDIVATDPYTCPAYTARTSRPCHPLSFTDLANGDLPPGSVMPTSKEASREPIWDIIICSFALHLVTSPSELFALLYELSGKARWLVVIAPHKKPEVKETWGWSRYDIASWSAAGEAKLYTGGGGKPGDDDEEETELEIVRDKVKLRLYRSNAF
ncbi:hypothetical protein IAU59_007279 [Kwoniella sp. CBS 9459]